MMMQTNRAMRYNVSGVQPMAGQRINVRTNVTLPDAEAGREWEEERRPFRAPGNRVRTRRFNWNIQVPMHIAALCLCALFVAFGIAVVSKAARKAQISKDITAIRANISLTMQENAQLTLEVAAARDSAHISYQAVNYLEMVDASTVKAVPVVAPDTRPNQAAQTLPAYGWNGMISGSR